MNPHVDPLQTPIHSAKQTLLRRLPLAVLGCALILYLSTLSQHLSEGEDSAFYVEQVTRVTTNEDLFHPNHLIFNLLGRLVYLLFLKLGYHGNACLPMQLLNVLAGALSLAVMTRILCRLGLDFRLTLAWVSVTAISYGFWSYSTQPETYVLPCLPILLCVDLVIGLAESRFSYKIFALLGLNCALATLLHQQHLLILLAVTIACAVIGFRSRSDVSLQRIALGIGILGLLAAFLIGVSYLTVAIGIFQLHDAGTIYRWAKGHAAHGAWTTWSIVNPLKSVLIGIPHTIFGGHFLCGFDFVSSKIPQNRLLEEQFLANHLPLMTRYFCLVATFGVVASALAVLKHLFLPPSTPQTSPQMSRRSQDAFLIFGLILIEYYVFNSIWEPGSIEFWIMVMPIAAMTLGLWQSFRTKTGTWPLSTLAFAITLFVANGLGSIIPQMSHETDLWYQSNRFLIQHAQAEEIIVTGGGYLTENYLKLYTPSEVIAAHSYGVEKLRLLLNEKSSKRIWVSSWVAKPIGGHSLRIDWRPKDEEGLQELMRSIKPRLIERDVSPLQTVYELIPVDEDASPERIAPLP